MEETFIHLRNSKGELKASIIYTPPLKLYLNNKGNARNNIKICYAVTIVSPSESQHAITLRNARIKLRARLSTATKDGMPSLGGISFWKSFEDILKSGGRFHSHGNDSAYNCIRAVGLDKIGCMYANDFESKVSQVRTAIGLLD